MKYKTYNKWYFIKEKSSQIWTEYNEDKINHYKQILHERDENDNPVVFINLISDGLIIRLAEGRSQFAYRMNVNKGYFRGKWLIEYKDPVLGFILILNFF